MSNSAPSNVRHRIWIPGFAILLAIIAIGTIQCLPEEQLPNAERRGMSVMTGIVAALVIYLWYVLLSGFGWSGRILALLAGVAVVVAGAFSIRDVEFTGEMIPRFAFTWDKTGNDRLDEFLSQEMARSSDEPVNVQQIAEQDVAEYRGIKRDGIVPGPPLATDWDQNPPSKLWSHPIGGGYAGFAVVDHWAFTIEQRGPEEAIVCYDVNTGRQRWVHSYPALFSEVLGGDGPRATPTIAHGRVYSLGGQGRLSCLNSADGSLVWESNTLEANNSANVVWGMSGSPLVLGSRVIVNPGSQEKIQSPADERTPDRFAAIAFDAETGKIAWKGGNGRASYASPMRAELVGVEQILIFDAVGLASLSIEDGSELWRFAWKSDYDINAAQPIVVDDHRVLISSNQGAALLSIVKTDSSWTVEEVWKNRNLKCDYANPILHEGHVYGIDKDILACISLEDGARKWKGGRYGHGQMLLRGDVLVVLTEKGEIALVKAQANRFEELARVPAIEGKTWNNPSLVGDRLLVRNHLESAAFKLPLADSTASR